VDRAIDHPTVRDYTRLVRWPAQSYVGRLEWQDPDALCCAYCDALLLPSEAQAIPGTFDAVCGAHCCAKGYVVWTHMGGRVVACSLTALAW
jgi:hypothetical protein